MNDYDANPVDYQIYLEEQVAEIINDQSTAVEVDDENAANLGRMILRYFLETVSVSDFEMLKAFFIENQPTELPPGGNIP